MKCKHSNISRPFTRQVPNSMAGLLKPFRVNGKEELEPDTVPQSRIICLDCGARADYDVQNFKQTGDWHKPEYVHLKVQPEYRDGVKQAA